MKFLFRDLDEGGSYQEGEGNLALGGIFCRGRYPPVGTQVEVRFRLPGLAKEVRADAELISVGGKGASSGLHLRFTHLDVKSELAIAGYLDSGRVP